MALLPLLLRLENQSFLLLSSLNFHLLVYWLWNVLWVNIYLLLFLLILTWVFFFSVAFQRVCRREGGKKRERGREEKRDRERSHWVTPARATLLFKASVTFLAVRCKVSAQFIPTILYSHIYHILNSFVSRFCSPYHWSISQSLDQYHILTALHL